MVHNILYYIVKEILKRTLVRMLICCVIALLFCITGNAKVPYIPKIINYSVSDYKAGNQNWAVSQGPGGKISAERAGQKWSANGQKATNQ